MRYCQFCEKPLDVRANGMAYSIGLAYDPSYAAHDACAVIAEGRETDRNLHRHYCHLDGCTWPDRMQPTKTSIEPLSSTFKPRLWN